MASPTRRADYYGLEISSEDTVVDVGCGDGAACVFAGELGAEVIGTDCDPIVLERLEQRMQGVPTRSFRGLLSDSDPLPLPDETADVVICTEVLEHVEAPDRIAAELARIGKPGARYLISVPHPTSEAVMRAVAPRWYFEKPYHLHIYEPERLDALLQSAGLIVESRTEHGFYWTIWWSFLMALGARPLTLTPDSPLLKHWEEAWLALGQAPGGPALAATLDRLVPKSQVRIARKAGRAASSASSFGGPSWRRSRWKRLVRDGSIRLGGFDLQWNVRRAQRGPGQGSAEGSPRSDRP
ncbi:hypothetical protein BH23PLA1_BH23PLA1_09210 [soil metagenome]